VSAILGIITTLAGVIAGLLGFANITNKRRKAAEKKVRDYEQSSRLEAKVREARNDIEKRQAAREKYSRDHHDCDSAE